MTVLLQITSGRGPVECCWVVARLSEAMIARDERSQSANRKRALERLAILLARNELREQARAQRRRWDAHNELVRGNPVRVYEGKEFLPH